MEVILMSRVIWKLQRNQTRSDYDEPIFPEFEKRRTWANLMSHSDEIDPKSPKMTYFRALQNQLIAFIGLQNTPPEQELLEIFGKKITNSHGISDNKGKNIGVGIDLFVSAYDHSCRPNVGIYYDGRTVIFRSLDPDKHIHDVTKVFTNYIELMTTRYFRQLELRRKYFFDCNCERCQDPLDLQLSSIRCPNRDCEEPIVMEEMSVPSEERICPKCSEKISVVHQLEGLVAMKRLQKWEEEKVLILDNLEVLDESIAKIQQYKYLLHPLNVYYADLFCSVLQLAMWTKERIELGIRYGRMALPCLKLCYPPKFKSFGFHILKIAYLHIHQRQYRDALPLVQEGLEVFNCCFGPDHQYSRQIAGLLECLAKPNAKQIYEPQQLINMMKF